MSPTSRRYQVWMFLILSGLLAPALEAQQRVAFVTSVDGTAVFGTWPEAGSAVGADAADAICRDLAATAALDNASTFVAWVSTDSDDAYCRLHGFTGTKSDNCGQAELPVGAGPWVRTDGLPFSESIDRLLVPEMVVYYPLALNENGNFIQGVVFTATEQDGTLHLDEVSCGSWTLSSSDIVATGWTSRSSWGWTSAGGARCDSANYLYCFEPGVGAPLTPPDEIGAVAFVTSMSGTGDLGSWPDAGGKTGLEAADATCQARAAAGSLDNPDDFKAWISSSTTDAKDRFATTQPIVRPDGVKVADNISDMLDSLLDSSINVTELGTYISNYAAWTATQPIGVLTGDTCSDWTSASSGASVRTGSAYAADSAWTMIFTTFCDFAHARLYCIEDQPGPIFDDGFESGDTTAWSSVVQRPLDLR